VALERAEISSALGQKGFSEEAGRDHIIFRFTHEGLARAVWTKISRGTKHKTIGDPLVAAMSKQLRLTKGQFAELVSCTIGHGDYVSLLREQGILPPK
jgi:hypothetical protein